MFVISAMLAGVLSLVIVFGPFLIPDYIRKLKNRRRGYKGSLSKTVDV